MGPGSCAVHHDPEFEIEDGDSLLKEIENI